MRTEENNTPLVIIGLLLTIGILIAFQVYLSIEPARIDRVLALDRQQAFDAGRQLFENNCVVCHGQNGEGNIGPALNNPDLLNAASDDTLFSVVSSGVPNTAMPAWNQSHGGPFTDDQVRELVAYVRAWQFATQAASQATAGGPPGNPTHGSTVFQQRCAACHGDNGQGVVGPALNDKTKLGRFDNSWYSQTITDGRPSKGMPTWGTVLSPQDVADVVSYIRQWATVPQSATPTPGGPTPEIARPSNAGGPGEAITLTGDAISGAQIFVANCAACHGQQGVGGVPNPGSDDGTVPPLNPVDETLISANQKVYATNLDLFIEHGSTPSGSGPDKSMPAWGDEKKLAPQQIADVITYIMTLNPPPATPAPTESATPEPTVEVARPSNPGGPGDAINLTGDAASGRTLFNTRCQVCHGARGVGGIVNLGSTDGTVPPLNPIDETLIDPDPKVYATNLDLFVEHGSTPEAATGQTPKLSMPAWGDGPAAPYVRLKPQEIADLIAYVMSLNPAPPSTPTETATPQPAVEVARPSNPGGPGDAVNLAGDAAGGRTIFNTRCQVCHGARGVGGIVNLGSTDGTVPPLNPIDETLIDPDPKVYATNLDLFVEHGSTPEATAGQTPKLSMPAWGDGPAAPYKKLMPQEIADVIAYIMSLNPAK